MNTSIRRSLAVAVSFAAVLSAGLTVLSEQPLYAKGPVKPSGDSGSSSSSSRSSGSSAADGRSESRSDSGSSARSDSNRASSSSRYTSGVSIGGRSESRYDTSPRPSSRPGGDIILRTPGARIESKRPTPTYRKDYASIGDLWKNRQEKRDDSSTSGSWGTSDGRYGRTGYGQGSSGSWRTGDGRHGSYYGYDGRYSDRDRYGWHTPSFRYRYYCYDYRPTACYPSLYCYYYDYCPPYVIHDRVIFISILSGIRTRVEVPYFIYRKTGDYYLSSTDQRSLWAAVRDIQQAWERSDPEYIMDHVERRSAVDVYLNGEYTYSLDEYDYYDMTRDAMSVIRTRSFDFEKVNRIGSDRYVAHGVHIYSNRYGIQETVFVTYTLERCREKWYITAVGSSTRPI